MRNARMRFPLLVLSLAAAPLAVVALVVAVAMDGSGGRVRAGVSGNGEPGVDCVRVPADLAPPLLGYPNGDCKIDSADQGYQAACRLKWGGVGDVPTIGPGGPNEPLACINTPTATATPLARNKFLQPFASDSPWNMPIGSGATPTAANLGTPIQWETEWEIIGMDPAAPSRSTFNRNSYDAACSGGTSFGSFPVPDGLTTPLTGGGYQPNNAGAFIKADGTTIQEGLWVARCTSTGPLYWGLVSHSPTHSIYGSGVGIYAGHGGSGLSAVGGSLRAWEVPAGVAIRHALKLTLPASTLSNDQVGACDGGYRWPAITADTGWQSSYTGSVPSLCMGSLLMLPGASACDTGAELTRRICAALRDYGAYVVDIHPTASGWRPFTINAEVNSAPPFNASEMFALFAQLQVVTNNASGAVGGGGTPRVPLAPPISN